jgi:hypothetical protein
MGGGETPKVLVSLAVGHRKRIEDAVAIRVTQFQVEARSVRGFKLGRLTIGIGGARNPIDLMAGRVGSGHRITVSLVGHRSTICGFVQGPVYSQAHRSLQADPGCAPLPPADLATAVAGGLAHHLPTFGGYV